MTHVYSVLTPEFPVKCGVTGSGWCTSLTCIAHSRAYQTRFINICTPDHFAYIFEGGLPNASQQHANVPSNGYATDPDVQSTPAPSTEISGSGSLSNPTFLPNIFPNLTNRGSINPSFNNESHLVSPCNLLTHLCAIHRLYCDTQQLPPDVIQHNQNVVMDIKHQWSQVCPSLYSHSM